MHALGIVLIWTALQVTVICLVILIVLRFARNSEPLWRAKVGARAGGPGGAEAVALAETCAWLESP